MFFFFCCCNTLKQISLETTFPRTSIYNYFQTKEEIFLALFQREYDLWTADIRQIFEKYEVMTVAPADRMISSAYSAAIRGRQDIDIYPQVGRS